VWQYSCEREICRPSIFTYTLFLKRMMIDITHAKQLSARGYPRAVAVPITASIVAPSFWSMLRIRGTFASFAIPRVCVD
jgi:hypothetical protein